MERFLSLLVFLAVGICLCAATGLPFDYLKFVPFDRYDKARLVRVGRMNNNKSFVARVTVEGNQIPGTCIENSMFENYVYFAYTKDNINETRFVRHSNGNLNKMELLQHSVRHGGGATWEYYYKDVRDDTPIVFGRLSSGEKVYACRAASTDGLDDFVLGRYVVGRSGCHIHLRKSWAKTVVDHFEVLKVSMLGRQKGGARKVGQTEQYCGVKNSVCSV